MVSSFVPGLSAFALLPLIHTSLAIPAGNRFHSSFVPAGSPGSSFVPASSSIPIISHPDPTVISSPSSSIPFISPSVPLGAGTSPSSLITITTTTNGISTSTIIVPPSSPIPHGTGVGSSILPGTGESTSSSPTSTTLSVVPTSTTTVPSSSVIPQGTGVSPSILPGATSPPSIPPSSSAGLSSTHESVPVPPETSTTVGGVESTAPPRPVVTTSSSTVIDGETSFIPIISGGPTTTTTTIIAIITGPPLGTIEPTGTEAQSSASQLSSELAGIIPLINTWIKNPEPPEASGVINQIEGTRPHVKNLLDKLKPDPSSSGCAPSLKRDLSSRGLFSSLFDVVTQITCSVTDIAKNIKNNLLDDVKSNIEDLKTEIENLKIETEDNDQPSSESSQSSTSSESTSTSSSSSTTTSSCETATVSDCSIICDATTSPTSTMSCTTTCYSTFSGCSATGETTTTTIEDACPMSTFGNLPVGEDFPMSQPLGAAGIAHPGGVSTTSSGSPSTTGGSSIHAETGAGSSLPLPTSTPSVAVETTTTTTTTTSSKPPATTTTTTTTTTSSKPPTTTTTTTTTSVPPPDCMQDGAPWYSPTSWCACGPSTTYPILSGGCSYTSLPASTIQPVSTTTAPTNVPGQNGLPGCQAIVASSGTSAHCNCGGTLAPTLSPTVSSIMNCAYTTQPTSSYDPAPPPATTKPAPPPYATGKCNVHVRQGLGQEYTDPEVVLTVNITDASGTPIGYNERSLDWEEALNTDSELPWVMVVTPQSGIDDKKRSVVDGFLRKRIGGPVHTTRPLWENGVVSFAYADQAWDSSSTQCALGGWDNGDAGDFFGSLIFGDDFIPNRQMDCQFDCPAPATKKKRDGDDASLEGRAPEDVWNKYAGKGREYYQEWQNKNGPDKEMNLCFEQYFEYKRNDAAPAPKIRPALVTQGYSVDKQYVAFTASGPKANPIADFQNTISATQGVFLANANDRGARKDPPRRPIPWKFSDVAWEMWKLTVLQQNPQWQQNPSLADYSGIRSFWRREIDNEVTQEILNRAFTGVDLTAVQTWYPTDKPEDEAFWALLGSPNGNGIQHFLTDHKVAVQGKGVVSIQAILRDGEAYSFWANIA